MQEQFELGDILASVEAWEKYERGWLENLSKAKQTKPSDEIISNLRATFVEFFMLGRMSNASTRNSK